MKSETIQKDVVDQFSTVNKIEEASKNLRIYCKTAQQKKLMLKGGIVAGIDVVCSEPRTKSTAQPRTKTEWLVKVFASGVPTDVTDDEIREAAAEGEAKRI
jgi:hypothetical protein